MSGEGMADPSLEHSTLRQHGAIAIILALFAVVTAIYSATVPLGETPDELAHYQYVRYLDEAGHPPLTAADRQRSGYKGHEPPLYYLMLHRLAMPLRIAQQPMLKLIDPDRYPRHSIGDEVMLWNAVLHTQDEAFPWQGTSLIWHLLRLCSIPLGMVTILCTYHIGRSLFPRRPTLALLAAGLNAFTPQFIYLSGALNNDNLAVPLAVLSLWVLLRLARGDLRWRWFGLLGVLIGLGRITKFYTLILLPIAAVSVLLIAWRRRCWRRCLLGGALVVALAVAVSAPWIMAVQPDDPAQAPTGALGFALKMLDILHTDRIVRSQGMRAAGGGLAALPAMLLSFLRLEPGRWATLLFKSFWAYYGPMTVEAGGGIYLGALGLVALALAGWARLGWRRLRRRSSLQPAKGLGLALAILGLQAAAFILLEALFYSIMRRLPDTAQGRHLFSAMPAWMLFLALGLLAWAPPRWEMAWAGIWPVALLGVSLYCLPAYVLAAYAPPLPLRTTLPASWQPAVAVAQEAAPGVGYLGYSPAKLQARAGERAEITLLWQAKAPIPEEYLLRIDLVAADGTPYLLYLAQPTDGRWPTRAWDPGDFLRDRQTLALPPVLGAGNYLLTVRWVNSQLQPLGASLPAGVLEVISSGKGALPVNGVRVEAASSPGDPAPILRYRQAASITLVHPEGAPPELALAAEERVWRPLAWITYPPQDDLAATRAFFLVEGTTAPGVYAVFGKEADVAHNRPILRVEARRREYAIPEGILPVGAAWDEGIALVGYRLEGIAWAQASHSALGERYPVLQAGETLRLVLVWRASQWINRNYTVFTHLLDPNQVVRAQHDQVPRFNYATLFWTPGEVVTDAYQLSLPADAQAGTYILEVGLYQRLDGARLRVRTPAGSDTRFILTPVMVTTR